MQSSVLLLNRYYQFSIIQAWVIIVCCSGVIIWLSPVDNINRMLEDIEKIYFQRKTQNIVLGILLFSGICTLIRLMAAFLIIEIMIVVGFRNRPEQHYIKPERGRNGRRNEAPAIRKERIREFECKIV